eukprot:s443_g17.t1
MAAMVEELTRQRAEIQQLRWEKEELRRELEQRATNPASAVEDSRRAKSRSFARALRLVPGSATTHVVLRAKIPPGHAVASPPGRKSWLSCRRVF